MTQVALFVALNVAVWKYDFDRITAVCDELGRAGYMAYPLFVRFPLWGFKRIDRGGIDE